MILKTTSIEDNDSDFTDVTLVCEDGPQVQAHKVILAASSPFFQKLLGKTKHPHPLVYMKGAKFGDLSAIMDFLYHGEANVFQENLESFLALAEELQLKGLTGRAGERVEDPGTEEKLLSPPKVLPALNAKTKPPKTSFKRETSGQNGVESTAVALPRNHSG